MTSPISVRFFYLAIACIDVSTSVCNIASVLPTSYRKRLAYVGSYEFILVLRHDPSCGELTANADEWENRLLSCGLSVCSFRTDGCVV